MEEKAASSKYFREHTAFVEFPRLRVAVENGHKEFVAQVRCQHFLSDSWYRDAVWQGTSVGYKTLYVLLQVALTPVHVAVVLVFQLGRRAILMSGDLDLAPEEVGRGDPRARRRLLSRFLRHCAEARCNLDVPLNRFFSTFGYNVLFIILLAAATLMPLSPENSSAEFRWYHGAMLAYSLSALIYDFLLFVQLRSAAVSFFNIWRVWSLVTHLFVILHLILNLVLDALLPCRENVENAVFLCPPDYLELRRVFSNVSMFLFATVAVTSAANLNYYAQMHPALGPIIITWGKVMLDVFTMMLQFLVILVAFSFSFITIWTSDYYVSSEGNNRTSALNATLSAAADQEKYDSNFFDVYFTLLAELFWSILDPGPYFNNPMAATASSPGVRTRYFALTAGSALFQGRIS